MEKLKSEKFREFVVTKYLNNDIQILNDFRLMELFLKRRIDPI